MTTTSMLPDLTASYLPPTMELPGTQIGQYAPDFELRGIDNQVHHLARYLQHYRAIGVVVLSNQCPYVQTYLTHLNALHEQFAPHGFVLIGINGNDDRRYPEDSFDNMRGFAKDHQLAFPYLRDTTQDVLRSFGVSCTTEAFLIDQSGRLCYRGAINDSGKQLGDACHHYFQDAIAQLLNNEPVELSYTQAIGQIIKWRT